MEEIASVFSEEIPSVKKGLDRFKSRALVPGSKPSYDSAGDLQKLAGKLQLHKEAELKKLESDPLRLALHGIDEHIYKCRSIIESGDVSEAERLLRTLVNVYAPDIDGITNGLSAYDSWISEKDFHVDLGVMIEKLERYKARISLDSVNKSSPEINVSSSSNSNSAVTVEVTMTQAVRQVDAIPATSLDDELKKELKLLLLDLESSKDGGKSAAEPKVKKILAWLADKSVDVAIAAAPYLAAVLQSLG